LTIVFSHVSGSSFHFPGASTHTHLGALEFLRPGAAAINEHTTE